MPLYVQPTTPQRPFRVLVCGGRDFRDRRWLDRVLDGLHSAEPIFCIIQGGARGADTLAAQWAHDRCVPLITFFANWDKHGKGAGAIRNQEMLEVGQPQLVVAFPGGRGTADMMRRAEKDDAVSTMSVSRSASADTHPKGGDVKQAPLVSGAVPERQTLDLSTPSTSGEDNG